MSGSRQQAIAIICAVCCAVITSSLMQAFTVPSGIGRAPARTARHALNKNEGPSDHQLETPEVHYFANQRIKDCLTEGCPVEEVEELEAMLARDEARVSASIKVLRAEMEEKHSHAAADMLAMLRNFLGDSAELREQLEVVKSVKKSFQKHLAAALPFGHGSTAGYLNRGVGIVQPRSTLVPLHASRPSARTALRATAEDKADTGAPARHLEAPEVNFFAKQRIMECLTEGCSVVEIEELKAMLSRDEARTEVAIAELRAEMEQEHSHEAAKMLGLLRNFLADSRELREQLELVKSIKKRFEKHLAGAIRFGQGSTAGFLKRGVGIVQPTLADAAFVGAPSASRPARKTTLRAVSIDEAASGPSGKRLEMPEANVFVNKRIMNCLTEGCPVQEIEELEGQLVRDEERIKAEIAKLRVEMEDKHQQAVVLKKLAEKEGDVEGVLNAKARSTEAQDAANHLAMLRNFLGDSEELREQLQSVKDVKQQLFEHLAGAIPLGKGDTAGFINRGVGSLLSHDA